MDDFTLRLAADAAEAENNQGDTAEGKRQQTENEEEGPTLSSMFGFAASWGKRLQDELHLDQLVDQVKKQSEEVTQAYRDDIAEFAQAVRVGATRGMDELSTRFGQLKTDLEAELQDKEGAEEGDGVKREVGSSAGLLQGFGKHFQMDALRQRQEKAKRLVGKLGTDLEDLLRDAIVIEAPGSSSTEEQRTAARKIIYDRRMAQLAAIQESEDTYLVDPEATESDKANSSLSDDFATFSKDFDLASRQEENAAAELLKDNPAMAEIHKKLVPELIEDRVFWTRYFFHAWLVDQEETRRKKLVEAAVAATEEDQFSWDLDGESDAEGSSPKKKNPPEASSSPVKEEEKEAQKSTIEPDAEKKQPQEKPAKGPTNKGDEDDEAWGEWE
ncbi:hypothetical protein EV175_004404 [Coemansia sp. RSA 1933]|nr:hypothetical protein EV175_004404 [Coemansia sp. RSA 1933]